MKWALRSGLLALFSLVLIGTTKADTVYDYTLNQGATTIATFTVPQFPTVANANLMGTPGMGIIVTPTNFVIGGSSSTDSIEFFNSGDGGGLEDLPPLVTDTPAFNMVGGQLYASADGIPANAETDPEMLAGSFTLFPCLDLGCESVDVDTPYTLSSVTVTTNTPEPSGLLLLGVGLSGLLISRKRFAIN